MIAAVDTDLLYPLTLFSRASGHELPAYTVIAGAEMPEPYRRLLVHHGDMTSRLENFHAGEIVIEALRHEHTPAAYRREVVLRMDGTGKAVEYGAIEIELSAFNEEIRRLILEEHLPLGGLLNRFKVQYRSEPRAFIKLGPDVVMQQLFETPAATEFYGRCNRLLDAEGRVLARIVEILRPCEPSSV